MGYLSSCFPGMHELAHVLDDIGGFAAPHLEPQAQRVFKPIRAARRDDGNIEISRLQVQFGLFGTVPVPCACHLVYTLLGEGAEQIANLGAGGQRSRCGWRLWACASGRASGLRPVCTRGGEGRDSGRIEVIQHKCDFMLAHTVVVAGSRAVARVGKNGLLVEVERDARLVGLAARSLNRAAHYYRALDAAWRLLAIENAAAQREIESFAVCAVECGFDFEARDERHVAPWE